MKTKRDEGLEWLWKARREIAKGFDYDPKKAAAHYRRRQKRIGARIYRPEEHPVSAGVAD